MNPIDVSTSSIPAAPPLWIHEAIEAAAEGALLAGYDELFVLAPYEIPPSSEVVVGAGERLDTDEMLDVGAELLAAFGEERLMSMVVAYVDCFRDTRDSAALAKEVAGVGRVAGMIIVVEAEAPHGPGTRVVGQLDSAGCTAVDYRIVPRDGGSALSPPLRRVVSVGVRGRSGTPARTLRVAISDHQGKSRPLELALRAAGHEIVDWADVADVVLIDHDVPFHGKLPLVEACVENGGRALLYPHGADATLMSNWDGLYPVSPLISGALVHAEGYAEVARRWGYPHPTYVVGFGLSEPRERQVGRPVEKVLFAPTHPPYFVPHYRERNIEVFEKLLRMPIEITVRHIGGIEENGLWPAPDVRFVPGDMLDSPGMIDQIDAADAVVADRCTFGNLAIARGITTVLWDSAVIFDNEMTREPDHVERYRDYVKYPFDVNDGDLWETLQAASRDTERVGEWKRRFIGDPLNVDALITAIRGG